MSSSTARSCASALILLMAGCGAPSIEVADQQVAASEVAPTDADRLVGVLAPYEAPLPTWEQLTAVVPEPTDALIALTDDASRRPVIRHNATILLGLSPEPAARVRILDALADESRPELRAAAIAGVHARLRRDVELRGAVEDLLSSEHVPTARAAVLALTSVRESKAALQAADQLDLAPAVRLALDEALGREVAAPVTPIAVPTGGGGGRDR